MPATTRALGALVAAAALLLGTAAPATAESRTVRDRVNTEDPPYGDIRQVRFDNTGAGLRVTTTMTQVRRGRTYWFLSFFDDQGRRHKIHAYDRGRRAMSWVRVQEQVGRGYRRYECRGLTQDWNRRTRRVTVFIPDGDRSCGGPADRYFYVSVSPLGDAGVSAPYDIVRSGDALPPG